MTRMPRPPDDKAVQDKRRVTWLGVAVNLPLALGKVATGVLGQSQALLADGVHSLADLASDATVLWALSHSARGPDQEHPYGHGRFETLATLAVSAMLALTALGLLAEALLRLTGSGALPVPSVLALVVALGSIAVKEALYHITLRVGRATRSALIEVNAWHHRSDALSSVVAALGIAAGLAGVPAADPLAAGLIALMLLRVAWSHGRPAVRELVDSQARGADRAGIAACLYAAPGVTGVRNLRVRQHGDVLIADAGLLVDPHITVTEGHRIAEAAQARAVARIPELAHLVLHVEPDGHAEGYGANAAPLRAEIEADIADLLQSAGPGITLQAIRLGYFTDGIAVEVVAEIPCASRAHHAEIERDLADRLRPRLPRLRSLHLHLAAPGDGTGPVEGFRTAPGGG